MVVVVSNDIEVNQLSDLRGKRLCHPGFDENGWLNDWSEVFSQVWTTNTSNVNKLREFCVNWFTHAGFFGFYANSVIETWLYDNKVDDLSFFFLNTLHFERSVAKL